MKLVKSFVHHVRAASVVEALADAGFRNLTLHDVKGMLKPINDSEQDYSRDASSLVISEARLSLVVEDQDVDAVVAIIRTVGRVGNTVAGYVYVSPVDQAFTIGGPEAAAPQERRA